MFQPGDLVSLKEECGEQSFILFRLPYPNPTVDVIDQARPRFILRDQVCIVLNTYGTYSEELNIMTPELNVGWISTIWVDKIKL